MNLKAQIKKVLWITLAWTIISFYQFLIGWGSLLEATTDEQRLGALRYDISTLFQGSLFTGFIAGLMGGTTLVFTWEKWLRTEPYGWTLTRILISFTIIFFLVSIPTSAYYNLNYLQTDIFDSELWSIVLARQMSPVTLIPYIFWLTVVLGTLIVFLVNDKYGPGVFIKFLKGQYFHPSREERVFMFLDLRSSTTIAESLGEEKYFEFLREVVQLSTDSILRHKGEIYQYVGDEIVISWPLPLGIDQSNCINCFFDVQKTLRDHNKHFENQYGIQPEFKAGLHFGNVMAGEIGVVKRDIAYSGDVLNTTARIQSKCNELGVDILLSKSLVDKINSLTGYISKELGAIELRGKKQKITLCTLVGDS